MESIAKALSLDRRRGDEFRQEVSDEGDDMLDLTSSQLPKRWTQRDFDWTGQTNYTGMHRKVRTRPP